jgi:ribosomal protein L44E
MSTKHVRSAPDLARFKCGLKIECGSCGNSRTMDGIEVAKAWGTKPFATIRLRMKCSRCGEKDAQLTVLSPPGPR